MNSNSTAKRAENGTSRQTTSGTFVSTSDVQGIPDRPMPNTTVAVADSKASIDGNVSRAKAFRGAVIGADTTDGEGTFTLPDQGEYVCLLDIPSGDVMCTERPTEPFDLAYGLYPDGIKAEPRT